MLYKSRAIDRFLRENFQLSERRFGLPDIGKRLDGEKFNPTVQKIADAINFYGYEIRDEDITTIPDTDLGGGNPIAFRAFPPAISAMKKALDSDNLYRYPYTEGSDDIRKELLNYVEMEGFVNDNPYSYKDIDDHGLSVHNITFLPSTSIIFNTIINIISKEGDVVLVPAPNYGLFTIRAERAGAEVEFISLDKEDDYLVNPLKLARKIDEINDSLQKVYNRRKGYVPRVVAFLNINPNNPTGKVMGEKQLSLLTKIGEVCLKRGVFVIDDLVYRDITFDRENIAKPMASIPGMFRNTISLFGLSKSYGLASLRAGFLVADEIIIREVINRTFQEMDSAPDITGRALAGAFNNTLERNKAYSEYFLELCELYKYKANLIKCLVDGIDTVEVFYKEKVISALKGTLNDKYVDIINGLNYAKLALDIESGFFAIVDFTEVKGKKYKGEEISTERDLLNLFYKTNRIRFLVGQSISWPDTNQIVARVTTALDDSILIESFYKMNLVLKDLEEKDDYIVRKNLLSDQEQMAHLKVDGWRDTYDKIIASRYLKALDYQKQTEKFIASFEEYKELVFVAVKGEEILGYSCFHYYDRSGTFDSELVSLYIKNTAQGRGIGTKLVKETMKELRENGSDNMIVWCLADNYKAIDFYKKIGGKKVIEKKAKIGDEYYDEVGFLFDLTK